LVPVRHFIDLSCQQKIRCDREQHGRHDDSRNRTGGDLAFSLTVVERIAYARYLMLASDRIYGQ
jgi:hypothetical protein